MVSAGPVCPAEDVWNGENTRCGGCKICIAAVVIEGDAAEIRGFENPKKEVFVARIPVNVRLM
jgi:hypothetical protein